MFIGEGADERNGPGRVLNGVDPGGGHGGVGGNSFNGDAVELAALARRDGAHAGGLADEAEPGPDPAGSHLSQQDDGAVAANLFVVRLGEMQWLRQRPGEEFGQEGQDRGAEGLHVRGAATVEPPLPGFGRERVTVSRLAVHGDYIGVAGQHDAAADGAIVGRNRCGRVGFVAVRAGNDHRGDAVSRSAMD